MIEAHNHPRFCQGRDRLAMVVRLLLQQNNLTHTQLHEFYRWISPDTPAWLSRSQISTLRNSKLPKPGPQLLDALGLCNLRLAQLAGVSSPEIDALPAIDELGLLPRSLQHLKAEKPWFMQNPHTGLPMDGGDFFRLYCGRLVMDEVAWQELPAVFDDADAAKISSRLAIWAQRWMVAQGLIPMEAREKFLEAFPVEDQKRQDRLWAVALGQKAFSGTELVQERDALRFLVGALERGNTLSVREFDRWVQGLEV